MLKDCDLMGFSFFFQAEDGIRDWSVTGVQTCALPIFDCFCEFHHFGLPYGRFERRHHSLERLGRRDAEPFNLNCFDYHVLDSFYSGKAPPNIGRPLFDSPLVASSCRISQCSVSTPSAIRTMSAAIQLRAESPWPEKRP